MTRVFVEAVEREISLQKAIEEVQAEKERLGVHAGHANHCHVRIVPSPLFVARQNVIQLEMELRGNSSNHA